MTSIPSSAGQPQDSRGKNFEGDEYARGLDVFAAKLSQHESSRRGTDLVVRLDDGRKRRLGVDPCIETVEPNDGEVVGHCQSEFGELLDATNGISIGREQERRHRHSLGDELPSDIATAELTVVVGGEEPLRISVDPVGRHRHAGTHRGVLSCRSGPDWRRTRSVCGRAR